MKRRPTPCRPTRRRTALPLAALCLLALACGADAQTTNAQTTKTYRWVDAQGVVHYSDTAQPGAQVIQLPAAQTYHSPPTPPSYPVNSPAADSAQSATRSCAITQPAPEASFFAPDSVAVGVSPALQPGDQLAVTLDGAPLGSGGGGQYQIQQPDRGAHTLSAMVRDVEGKLVCQSTVTFYVQRPSGLSPTSPARGH